MAMLVWFLIASVGIPANVPHPDNQADETSMLAASNDSLHTGVSVSQVETPSAGQTENAATGILARFFPHNANSTPLAPGCNCCCAAKGKPACGCCTVKPKSKTDEAGCCTPQSSSAQAQKSDDSIPRTRLAWKSGCQCGFDHFTLLIVCADPRLNGPAPSIAVPPNLGGRLLPTSNLIPDHCLTPETPPPRSSLA